MATNNALSIKINGLETFSPSTKHFLTDYRNLSGYTHKRQKMMSVIRCGHIIERAGLTNLLAVVDTEEFFAADEIKQKAMIMRVLALGDFTGNQKKNEAEMSHTKIEEPPANASVVNREPEPSSNENSGKSSTDEGCERDRETGLTRDDHGSTEIVEPAQATKRSPSSLAALKSKAPRR
ncbi:hypothetical protein [Yersinia ruckeri]|uniref:hypothetical protein n=1 Tax=Yersinia ruckeri TaxID=29486 RepID=UPI0020BE65B6|nr:hypothetical protein [Yersinia ruckeri]EKN4689603.1 hypothetical protein [Yersinia ruckeri]MCK8586375.1 hypothetical protein [Yersinia ruckeri]MCW6615619.1 hypothetical protein [Yersinia ruckeri]